MLQQYWELDTWYASDCDSYDVGFNLTGDCLTAIEHITFEMGATALFARYFSKVNLANVVVSGATVTAPAEYGEGHVTLENVHELTVVNMTGTDNVASTIGTVLNVRLVGNA